MVQFSVVSFSIAIPEDRLALFASTLIRPNAIDPDVITMTSALSMTSAAPEVP